MWPAAVIEVGVVVRANARPGGSGAQVVGTPSFMGMPSAPGKVPKYSSNERFSCTTNITWLMLSMPAAGSIGRLSSGTAAASGGVIKTP